MAAASDRLYKIWCSMKQRCYNPNNPGYKSYGAKGITVCSDWKHSFKAFEAWALSNGYEETLSIDRIDPFRGYSPTNCQWLTLDENRKRPRRNWVYGMPTQKNLYLRCPPELKERLKQEAARAGVSLNALIISVLRQYAESKAG